MTNEEQFSREGIDTLSEVSAFLGGIFFTSLLILIQQRADFDVTLLEITRTIRISQLHLIAFPLSMSVILFVFSSIFFGIACIQVDKNQFNKIADATFNPFLLGFFSMFMSLFAILLLVDIVIGLVGIILSLGVLVWWLRVIRSI